MGYLGGHRVFKVEEGGGRGGHNTREPLLALETEEGARATECRFWKLERPGDGFPIEPLERNTALMTLDFSPWRPISDF